MALQVLIDIKGSMVVVGPVGDVDLNCARDFQTHLKKVLEGKPQRVIVDLSKVPYMDSSGVATLVEAMQIARKTASKLVLCGMQDKVRSIFEIARLDRVFTIVANMEAAAV